MLTAGLSLPLRLPIAEARAVKGFPDALAQGVRIDYVVANDADIATLNALPANALDNKIVGFNAGITLTSALVLTATGVTFKKKGAGTNPLFELRNSIAAGDWTVNGTYANCYDVTVALPGDSKMLGNFWVDNAMVVQSTSLANAAATLERFFVSDWTATSATLTYHTATDPRSSGKAYRYSARLSGIYSTGDNARLQDIDFIGNGHQDGGFRLDGEGVYIKGGVYSDGARHAGYAGANVTLDGCSFIRGRDDVEGSTANSFVANQTSVTGKTLTTKSCTFNGSDGAGYTGPYGHDAVAGNLFATVLHQNNVYRNMAQAHTICGVSFTVENPDAQNVLTFLSGAGDGFTANVSGMVAGSTVNQMVAMLYHGTLNSSANTCSVPALGAGFYRSSITTADNVLSVDGDNITFSAEASIGSPSNPIYWARGSVSVQNSTFGPAIGCPTDEFANVGVGAPGSLASSNNTFPLGAYFKVNGTNYNTLSALQAAGFDTGSVEAALPAAFFSDDFNRADGFLDGSTGWTRVGGSANQLSIVSGVLAATGTVQTLYRTDSIGSANHAAKVMVKGAGGTAGPLVAVRSADQSNFIGIRRSSTSYQFQACVGGTFTTDGAIAGITPGDGDEIILGARDNVAYGYLLAAGAITWRRLFLRDLSSISGYAGLSANTWAGLVPRNATQSPWIDSFSCFAI